MDVSGCSIAALEYASSLAEVFGASVDVLQVQAPDDFKVGSAVPHAPDEFEQAEEDMKDAIARVERRLGARLRRSTRSGDPLKEILDAAAEGDHDIIVMGTHGRVGRLHMLVGSVAEAVVRNAPCPVLTVRVPEGEESFSEKLRGGAPLGELVRARKSAA